MELDEIKKEIEELRLKQDSKLEEAYRIHERIKTITEIEKDWKSRWDELKERLKELKK